MCGNPVVIPLVTFPLGDLDHHLILSQLSQQPELHLDLFSHFCTAHRHKDRPCYSVLLLLLLLVLLLQPFYSPLDCVRDYPDELVPERQNQSGFTGARDSKWQWHQLGHMQICILSRQITTPASHHSVFYRPDALPATQPTAISHI